MKDNLPRRFLKSLARGIHNFNLQGTRLIWRLRGDKPYVLEGGCIRCGKSCDMPGIGVTRVTWYFPTFRWLFLAWQKHVNGFVLVDRDISSRTFFFRCTHFDLETRLCDSYESRPGFCRDYPRLHAYSAYPQLQPGCGFRLVDPNADKLLAALEREGLPPEKIENIKDRLHLRK